MWIPLFLLACSSPSAPVGDVAPVQEPAKAPNVVVILIDTLRVDRMSLYGAETDTMPFLSSLAADSALFEQAWSTSSWTAPSTASVFTGLYPNQHGVTAGLVATQAMREKGAAQQHSTLAVKQLPQDVSTLPQVFKAQGYETFAVTTNININREIGFDRGFDHFQFFQDGSARQVAETVVKWQPLLGAEAPYLLYLHFNDPHSPYLARDPWFVANEDELQGQLSAYDSELHYLDLYIGRLYEAMDWSRDTVLLVVSDHGEEFGEHGQLGHHFSLYREVNQVIWMAHGPGVKPARYTQNVSLVDVLPTAVALAGGAPDPSRAGVDLSTLLRDGSDPSLGGRTLYAHRWDSTSGELWAGIRGDWRLIDSGAEQKLYSIGRDPQEAKNLAATEPAVASQIRDTLNAFRAAPGQTWTEVQDVQLDPAQILMLEQLGYLEH